MRAILAGGLALSLAASSALGASPPQAGDPYYRQAVEQLERARAQPAPPKRAKNVILFVGDGMGISTVTAARIFAGQREGKDGESSVLSFERLPYLALSKTYAHDNQVPDSAAAATALLAGVKTRNGVIGLSSKALYESCASAAGASATSLAELAKRQGLAAGVVTNTRITDATPAAAYGHSPSREWEDDTRLPPEAREQGCRDLAAQLVEAPAGLALDVALGGGLARFLPEAAGGRRGDGRDLTREWLAAAGPGGRLARTGEELKALDLKRVDRLLGLFAPEHFPYLLSREVMGLDTPSLAEMTTAAIEVLKKNPKGFVLLVEGGMIDKASHLNNAARTLTETVAFAEAIEAALKQVDLSETLVVVTADHSHGLVISGGADRNAPILGTARFEGVPAAASDGLPYSILSYATGPGAEHGPRRDVSHDDPHDPDLRQPALAPMESAEHAGEDVAVYAAGPGADLVRGVVEQPYVFQVMRQALGLP